MKKPITTEDLFNRICNILKEKNALPEILDYYLPDHSPVPIKTYEYNLKNNLDYGGSEGIYLDLWIEFFADDEKCVSGLGTFKTLRTDNEAMHIMANLLADFIVEEYAYVNANLDDFTWEGADVYMMDDTGKRIDWHYTCSSMAAALKKKEELLEKYPQIVIRDNATRKETIYHQNQN